VPVPAGVVTRIRPVFAPTLTVAVIWASESTVNFTSQPPIVTRVAPVKSEPWIVTCVKRSPLVGVNEDTVGAGVVGVVTVKSVALASVPPGVVTAIGPVVAPTGTVAVICTPESTVKDAFVPFNVTAVAPVNPVPVIVTTVPSGPDAGSKLSTVGGTAPAFAVGTQETVHRLNAAITINAQRRWCSCMRLQPSDRLVRGGDRASI
jgi:hypothetical protein